MLGKGDTRVRKSIVTPTIAAIIALLFSNAFATHLGPIVFGEERAERVVLCFSLEDGMALATKDQESLKAGESLQQFLVKTQDVDCDTASIYYTPMETIYQWIGRAKKSDGTVTQAIVSLIKAQSGTATIYVIVLDEAPPPAGKQKL